MLIVAVLNEASGGVC